MKIKEIKSFCPEKLLIRALTAWILSSFVVSVKSGVVMTQKEYLTTESVSFSIILTVVLFAALNAVYFALRKKATRFEYESVLMLLSAVSYFSYCLALDGNVYLAVALCAISALCCSYTLSKNESFIQSSDISKKRAKRLVSAFAAIALITILSIGVFRCLTFSAPNYDLGIFTNTAYNLKTKLIQYNTCERDGLITHFQVHVSPILYFVTPFYYLFPSAITLQVIQGVAVISCVIPVYLICTNRNFSKKLTAVLCFIAVFYPALSTGTFYDFHENAFLPALILWMIYCYEKKRYVAMFVFAVLTLSVKEDASVYIAFFGLFLITRKGEKLRGLALTLMSVLYIGFCVWYINKYGFGAMTGRFKDYITDERLGLISLAANVVLDPVYVIKNCLNEEKLVFVLQVMGPFLFLPFVTKKYSRYILLGPFILMNLMPSYQYQHSIYFQYLFGVIPLLTYLTVINAGELSHTAKRKAISCCLCITTLCYCAFVIPKTHYVSKYYESSEKYRQITQTLDRIPDDASVSAPAFLLQYLANRDEIYENEYTDKQTDYIVFDLRYNQEKEAEKNIDSAQYEPVERHEGLIALYKMRTEG